MTVRDKIVTALSKHSPCMPAAVAKSARCNANTVRRELADMKADRMVTFVKGIGYALRASALKKRAA